MLGFPTGDLASFVRNMDCLPVGLFVTFPVSSASTSWPCRSTGSWFVGCARCRLFPHWSPLCRQPRRAVYTADPGPCRWSGEQSHTGGSFTVCGGRDAPLRRRCGVFWTSFTRYLWDSAAKGQWGLVSIIPIEEHFPPSWNLGIIHILDICRIQQVIPQSEELRNIDIRLLMFRESVSLGENPRYLRKWKHLVLCSRYAYKYGLQYDSSPGAQAYEGAVVGV